MIVIRDGGYTLHCVDCGANVSLSNGEIADQERFVERREAMALVHVWCHTFAKQAEAKAAMKVRRADMLRYLRSAAR